MRKIDKLFLMVGIIIVITLAVFVSGVILNLLWFRDVAVMVAGIAFEVLILYLTLLVLRNPNKSISGQCLFWSRIALIAIIALVIGCIVYVQYNAANKIQSDLKSHWRPVNNEATNGTR